MTLSVVTQIAPEDNLDTFENLLKSISFADNITVYAMEMEGDKDLLKLAKDYNLNIIFIARPASRVVEEIRAQQVREAKGDWVLVMDFDEVITPALRDEIKTIVGLPPRSSLERSGAYSIARQNFSLGYPLKRGGWGTDYVIRLFRKVNFLDWPTDIHSTPTFRGELGQLRNHMEHHKDQSLEYIVSKTDRYTDKEAEQYYDGEMAPVTSLTLLRKLKMEMIRRGIFKAGLFDGKIGLIQSIYQGFSVFLSYAKLYELQISSKTYNKTGDSNH
jgi:hypothetical protein